MVCRPASSEIATNGTPRQMFAAVTESRASQGSPRKSMYRSIRPIFESVQLTTENWEAQIHQNAMGDGAGHTTNGGGTIARLHGWNGTGRLKGSASQHASTEGTEVATV